MEFAKVRSAIVDHLKFLNRELVEQFQRTQDQHRVHIDIDMVNELDRLIRQMYYEMKI